MGGRGVDVVLNSLAGEGLVASWECIAPFGHFLEIGKKDILSHGKLPCILSRTTFRSVLLTLLLLVLQKPDLVRKSLSAVMESFRRGVLSTTWPLNVYGVSEIEQAFRLMQGGKNIGKIVIKVRDNEEVPVRHCKRCLL